MKKLLLTFVFIISVFAFGSIQHVEAATNSLRSNYEVYVVKDVGMYDKPNGKRLAVVRQYQADTDYPMPNVFIVKKFVANNWVLVTHKKADGKTIKGYVKTNHLATNYLSLDYVFINRTNGITLQQEPDLKSKVVTKIPYGTMVALDYNYNYKKYPSLNYEKWLPVIYVAKHHTYKGFVYRPYTR